MQEQLDTQSLSKTTAAEKYAYFITFLNKPDTSFRDLITKWNHPKLQIYCMENPDLQTAYKNLSKLLSAKGQSKKTIKDALKNEYKVIDNHFTTVDQEDEQAQHVDKKRKKEREENVSQPIVVEATQAVPPVAQQPTKGPSFFQTDANKKPNTASTGVQTEVHPKYLEDNLQDISYYVERRIHLNETAYTEIRIQLNEFCSLLLSKNTKDTLKMWNTNRLLKLFYFGYGFSSEEKSFFNIHKVYLIKRIIEILEQKDLFPIFCDMVEYNPELYSFLFESFKMFGRDNILQTKLTVYTLGENEKVLVNLITILNVVPITSSTNKVRTALVENPELVKYIKDNFNDPLFKPIQKQIVSLLPQLEPQHKLFGNVFGK